MRILLIEDYEPARTTLADGLREAGFAVDTAADGRTGLTYASTAAYDVIVLDLMLPQLDGLTVLKELRHHGRQTHVLILTARDSVENRIAGLNLGADDYLVKPFAFGELLARIRALVRRRYGNKDPQVCVGGLVIDTNHKAASRDGRVIDLTAREYAILEYLALRKGRMTTRTQIWEHIYELSRAAESNVVDVYIGRLRRKLQAAGLPNVIRTSRGQGYMLREAV